MSHDYAGCQDQDCALCDAYGDGGFASKVHKNEEKRMSERNTELDVLVTVRDYGALNSTRAKALERLLSLYPDDESVRKYDGILNIFIDALVDSGHLQPVISTKGMRYPQKVCKQSGGVPSL